MEQEAPVRVIDATLGAAKKKDLAVEGIDVGAGSVNAFIVGNDLRGPGHEYRCVGGVSVDFSIIIDGGDGGANESFAVLYYTLHLAKYLGTDWLYTVNRGSHICC